MQSYKAETFIVHHPDMMPPLPVNLRVCPTCLDAMSVHYAWKSSEHVVHYFCVCHCGSRTKGKLVHVRLSSRKSKL